MAVKQMKGEMDRQNPRQRNGDILIKIRPRLNTYRQWEPVLSVFAEILVTQYSGEVIYGAPPPGPLIRQLGR